MAIKSSNEKLSVSIVHFTPLEERKSFLESVIPKQLSVEWCTEKNIRIKPRVNNSTSILGVNPRRIGMDLGVNSRSLSRSWSRARLEGQFYFLLSHFPGVDVKLVIGDFVNWSKLPKSQEDNLLQHLTAMQSLLQTGKQFGLLLEDDAIPSVNTWEMLEKLLERELPDFYVAFLGSGANLSYENKKRDEFGMYRIDTFSSRTSVATLFSRPALEEFLGLIESYGIPDYVPIDVLVQVFLRKKRYKPFWQDPPTFIQGSESGAYKSSLR